MVRETYSTGTRVHTCNSLGSERKSRRAGEARGRDCTALDYYEVVGRPPATNEGTFFELKAAVFFARKSAFGVRCCLTSALEAIRIRKANSGESDRGRERKEDFH